MHVPGTTTHLTTYETDLVAIKTNVHTIGSFSIKLAEVNSVYSELLTIGSPSNRLVEAPPHLNSSFDHLVDLLLLAERGSLTDSSLKFEGKFAPSLLRLIAHERLITIVENLIFRAHPRYVEQTEELGIPRGRLNAKSLLHSNFTGAPWVESTFDELSTNTPILQIIASALRVVGSDRIPSKVAILRPRVQARAIQLLRHLSSVTLIDREHALLLADGLWVGPFDQIWKPAIDAAIPVLRDSAVIPDEGIDSTEAMIMHISTEKFWEQCLGLGLSSAFGLIAVSRNGGAGEGVSVPTPWSFGRHSDDTIDDFPTNSFPDFMFRARDRTIVADAKYKLGIRSVPGSSDSYQLFAYSHLATLNGASTDTAVILYPAREGDPWRNVELKRQRDQEYPLWLAYLPFPRPADLYNLQSWNSYIANLVSQIDLFADEWFQQEYAVDEE